MNYGQTPLRKDNYTGLQGASGFALGLAAKFVLQFLVIGVAGLAFFLSGRASGVDDIYASDGVNFAAMAATQAGFIAVFFFVSRKVNIRAAAGVDRVDKKDGISFLVTAAFSLVCIYMLSSSAFLFDKLIQLIGYKPAGLGVSFDSAGNIIAGIIVICILAPIGEELLFRGVVLGGLKSLYGEKKAIVFSALAFMLMHSNPEQTVYQFLLGLVLGGLVVVTGKIWAAILLHALNNGISLVIEIWEGAMFVPDFYGSMHWTLATLIYLGIAALGIAAAAGLFFVLRKVYNNNDRRDTPEREQKPLPLTATADGTGKAMFFVACGICAALWFFSFFTGMI